MCWNFAGCLVARSHDLWEAVERGAKEIDEADPARHAPSLLRDANSKEKHRQEGKENRIEADQKKQPETKAVGL
jgi:hypothetical protein